MKRGKEGKRERGKEGEREMERERALSGEVGLGS